VRSCNNLLFGLNQLVVCARILGLKWKTNKRMIFDSGIMSLSEEVYSSHSRMNVLEEGGMI